MKNLFLDTSIYGELVIDPALGSIKENVEKQSSVVVFGSPLVRKELRATPKKIRIGGRNLRIDLLNIYYLFTRERSLPVTAEAENLALLYYLAYRKLGGSKGKAELWNDYLLVASASLRSMDLVVSSDEATMKGEYSLQAYSLVNTTKGLRHPQFISYEQFKKLLR